MAVLDTQPEVGSTANRYEVLAKLASGGMAEIFLARTQSDAGVERYVVLKRVHKHRATDIKFVNMFLDEARLAAQLQHPNIAQVFDTGKLGDTYFFTMEYVHGETVRELLHRSYELQRPIPVACTLTIIANAAAGLQHAHDRVSHDGHALGIVHRDVSPSNLIVSYEGNVKIVDFGVAKAAHRSVETQSGTVKGKMGYMAPEQCRGGDVDRRCDLFCLGIVMWELLVGERLFKRATDFESMQAVVEEATPAPSSLRPDLPPALDAVVLKLLAKSPADRYQTADELLEALEAVAASTGTSISVAAVRRYIRELFGQPAEPWVELRRANDRTEAVTVTGAPINGLPGILELDGDELDRLRDLSSTPRDSMPMRVPASAKAAAARMAVADAAADAAEEAAAEAARARARRVRLFALVGASLVVAGVVYFVATQRSAGAPPADAAAVAVAADAALPAVSPDAAQVAAVDAGAPIDAPGKAPSDTPEAPTPTLATLLAEKRFAEAVTACQDTSPLAPATALDCTLAACRVKDRDAAATFVTKVAAAKKRSTLAACAKLGTKVRPVVATGAKDLRSDPSPKDPPTTNTTNTTGTPPTNPTTGKTGTGSGGRGKPKCDDPDPMACRE